MASTVGLLVALSFSFPQSVSLDTVLARAGLAAVAFHRDAGQLVARESYEQRFHVSPTGGWTMQSVRSEFAMVADEPAATWHGYRDVLEINGRRLPANAGGRLEHALLNPAPSRFVEAQRITDESASQLLGGDGQVVNAPAFALMVLLPAHQPRFVFTKKGEKRVGSVSAWVIRFRETQSPMFFRDVRGRQLPMTGEFWIDLQSGVVLRSQFAVDSAAASPGARETDVARPLAVAPGFSRMNVEVIFKPDLALGVTVPVEMREIFSREMANVFATPTLGATAGTRYWTRQLSCIATYSGHRRVVSSSLTENRWRTLSTRSGNH